MFSLCFRGYFPSQLSPSVLWYYWLGLLTCKNRLPYNLYCVGGDVKHCTILSNTVVWAEPFCLSVKICRVIVGECIWVTCQKQWHCTTQAGKPMSLWLLPLITIFQYDKWSKRQTVDIGTWCCFNAQSQLPCGCQHCKSIGLCYKELVFTVLNSCLYMK